MAFKKTRVNEWKMTHKNYTAYIYRWLGTFHDTYYLNIDIETFDGHYYETKRIVNEVDFYRLNEAKKYAKEYIN